MVFDGSAEADIRGIDIDKLAKGFGVHSSIFKNFVKKSKTSAREIRWYRRGKSLALAATPLDTETTQGITKSLIANTSFLSMPFAIEQKWERQTSNVRKYFVESPTMSMEDIKDTDPDVLGENVRAIVEAVGDQVDRRIYDVITEATTSGTPAPTTVNTTAAVDGWSTTATCNPILDILIGQRKMRDAKYDPKSAIIVMNQLEHQSLINFLISVKGSSIPDFATAKLETGVVMSLLGNRVVVTPNATADWVIQWIPDRSASWKQFIPITSVVMTDPGIGKKIRCWEEGEAYLSDPLSVHIISAAS